MRGRDLAAALAVLAGCLAIGTLAVGAPSEPSGIKFINAKIESQIIGAVPLRALDRDTPRHIIWCFGSKPAFAFERLKGVARMTFDGSVEEIIRADVPLHPGALECSDSGEVVTAISREGAKFFIRKGSRFGIYKTSGFKPLDIRSKGHLLSPAGDTLIAPVDLTYESGDDVLSTMRVVKLRGESISWRGNEVTFFDPQELSVRTYNLDSKQFSTLLTVGERYKGEEYDVSGIANCARHTLVQIASHLPKSEPNASADRLFVDILRLNPTIEVFTSRFSEFRSISLYGSNFNGMCIITDTTGAGGPEESYGYFVLFDDGLVKYSPPAGVYLGYAVHVAPRGCLVLARQFKRKNDGASNEEFVIGLRVTRAGPCA